MCFPQQFNEMKVLLAALYKQSVPLADGSVTLQMVNFSCSQSDPGETVDLFSSVLPVVLRVVFFSEGEQLVVSTEVSPPVGHTEGREGVSSTGVYVALKHIQPINTN